MFNKGEGPCTPGATAVAREAGRWAYAGGRAGVVEWGEGERKV
jgi:hypothetical protein